MGKRPALNADPFAQLRLLDLQALDSKLDQLAHRRSHLPELAEVAELSTGLASVRDRIVEAETAEGDISREVGKAEADVEQVRARSSRDQQRLDAGQVSSPKELENLQHEIASLSRRQAELEDTELEVLQRLEDVQTTLVSLREEQGALQERLADAEQRRDAAFAGLDADGGAARADRDALAPQLPADLVALYDKLRAANGGVGAAALHQRRCEGCRLELNTTDVNTIRAAASNEVIRCEECRRILIRTADSGL